MVYIGPKSKSVSEHLSRRFLRIAGVGFLAYDWSICNRLLEKEIPGAVVPSRRSPR